MDSTYTLTPPVSARRSKRQAARAAERALPQLSLRRIIAVWAAAAVPMGLLSWVAAPLIADQLSGPNRLVRALIIALTAGLVYQFVLVMTLVAREQGSLRFSVLRDALWLRAPHSPKSGRRGGRVWFVVVPLVIAVAAVQALPGIAPAAGRDLGEFLGSDSGEQFLSGAWGWFALLAAMFTFNTVLGEELLFRGYLLPRMNGRFGDRDWLANGVLFAAYHVHVPWAFTHSILEGPILAGASKRYRSALMGIALHSVQSVVFLGLVLALVLKG